MKSVALALVLGFSLCVAGQNAKSASGSTVDKAYMQTIWDGWGTLDASKVKPYYAQGPHVFFDIAPLKYNSWDEYESGVTKMFADYNSAKFTVNDDLQIHKAGPEQWVTSTVAYDMTHKSGKHDMGQMRWTAVFEKQGTKWLIVHEHVSVPMQ